MTTLRPAEDADAAQWLLEAEVDWSDLVTFGPPGYETYVRIAFPEEDGTDVATADEPADVVRLTLTTLAAWTATPSSGFAAIWEGWGGRDPAPVAPRVRIPHREMLLFRGEVHALRNAPVLAWQDAEYGEGPPPHLVWPEDRAWCLACEVDEEIEFTVGCSADAAGALATALPTTVRRVAYGDPVPVYRDPS